MILPDAANDVLDRLWRVGNHDLLSGLPAIHGFAQLLLHEGAHLTDEQRAYLEHISLIAQKTRRVQRAKIMMYSILTSTHGSQPPESVELIPLLDELAAEFDTRQTSSNVELTYSVQNDLPSLLVNRSLLAFILRSLADDAQPGTAPTKVHFQLHADTMGVHVTIRPIGLAGSEHQAIFEIAVQHVGGQLVNATATELTFVFPTRE